jgi:heptosyltransferase-3
MATLYNPPQSVLVLPPPFVGDAIVDVPLLAALRQALPNTTIGHAVAGGGYELLKHLPTVDRWHMWQHSTPKTWRELSAFNYDAVLLLRTSFRDAWLAKRAGIPVRIGYSRQRFFQQWYRNVGACLTHVVPHPLPNTCIPQAEFVRDAFVTPLLQQVGILAPTETLPPNTTPLSLAFDESATSSLLNKLPGFVHLTAASKNKGIDGAVLLPALVSLAKHHGYQLVMTGPANMRQTYEAWWATPLARAGISWVNMAGNTTLPELAVLLREASLLLSLDSATLHMAAAMQTPAIVGIYGATSAQQWVPYWPKACGQSSPFVTEAVTLALPCRATCYTKHCSHNQCRADLTSHHVLRCVELALAKGQARNTVRELQPC